MTDVEKAPARLLPAAKPRLAPASMKSTHGCALAAAWGAPSVEALSIRIVSKSRKVWAASLSRHASSVGPLW
jgi:hypothetical protein